MPKLATKIANQVEGTEATHGGDFEPIPAGNYLVRLSQVTVRDDTNKYDAAQWSAEFDAIYDLDLAKLPGRQWLNLTLPTTDTPHPKYEKDADKWVNYQNMLRGRLAAFFEAFGYSADSDTDEMLGEWAQVHVKITTIQQGANQGKKRNEIDDISPVPEDLIDSLPDPDAWSGSDDTAF